MRISDWSSDVCSSDLDQIVQRFGTDVVAAVTGRSRRIIRKSSPGGIDRLAVENRAGSANLAETQAFMADQKRILIDRNSGVEGKSVSVRVDLGGRRFIEQKRISIQVEYSRQST